MVFVSPATGLGMAACDGLCEQALAAHGKRARWTVGGRGQITYGREDMPGGRVDEALRCSGRHRRDHDARMITARRLDEDKQAECQSGQGC